MVIKIIKINWVPFFLTCIIFCQNPIWPIWSYGLTISFILTPLIFGYLIIIKNRKFIFTPTQWITIFLSTSVFIIFPLLTNQTSFSSYVTIISFLIACILTESEKIYTVKYVTFLLAIIIIISFPFWFFHAFIAPLPTYNEIDLTSMKGGDAIMKNHLFFVTFDNYAYERFYSMFDEPGVLGTFAAFVLFANQYNFKKKYLMVILIGGIFTYSLAFYVLTLCGYFFHLFKSKRNNFYSNILLVLFLCLIIFFIKDDDSFQNILVERLINIDDRVENRSAEVTGFDNYSFIDSMFGKGHSFISKNYIVGTSYKVFFLVHGILGAISLFIIYFSLIRHKLIYLYFLLILFFISFMQRPEAFTAWQILLYASSLSYIKSIRNKV